MNANKLARELGRLGINAIDSGDPNRPLVYLKQLRQVKTYLTSELSSETYADRLKDGADSFCRTALNSSNLLQELAEMLDTFVRPAIKMAAKASNGGEAPTNLDEAVYNSLFDDDDAICIQNCDAFLGRYPVTAHAVGKLVDNFKVNIRLACQRVFNDKQKIQTVFGRDMGICLLLSLDYITTTGSDFHKGGKQVLVLTLSAYLSLDIQVATTLKIVYKPSDIEIDCLIAGKSRDIDSSRCGIVLNTKSLAEIFNDMRAEQGNPSGSELLPTYKILPIKYMSTSETTGVTIPDCYGYIEYLSHETKLGLGILSWFFRPSSDFVIFADEHTKRATVAKFYRQLGHWLALACTFSIKDLHLENVRSHRCEAYLIDLEASLGNIFNDVTDTDLLTRDGIDGVGGIDGYNTLISYFKYIGHPPWFEWKAELTRPSQNRLYALNPTVPKLIAIDKSSLCTGLDIGMRILAKNASSRLSPWWDRLNNVLVREISLGTGTFSSLRDAIYLDPTSIEENLNVSGQLVPVINAAVSAQFVKYFNSYSPLDLPRYISIAPEQVRADYENMDLPVYYRRNDGFDLLDGRGNTVPVPATVTVQGVTALTNVGRTTFYPRTTPGPSRTAALKNRLDSISGDGNHLALKNRITQLMQSFPQYFGMASPNGSPEFAFERNPEQL